ncbi:glycosyltransferase family 2 protein, partial [Candidatus Microgenomates bacterium]|nr:glycosyltransferase family 2 protein [Candidatus Microgenomates bacterium]
MIETLAKIFSQVKNHKMELLYIDDTSPDKTYEIVREKMKKYKWLHLLLNTEKRGLGVAYMKGFQYAIEKINADYLMEFDGDFQHDPNDIPRLVEQIDKGYDFIVGSRYIKGGSIPKEWGFKRQFLSVVGNLVARVLLVLPQVHDVTGGFRLSKVKGFMEDFPFEKILSRSFAYKIHTFFYMVQKGAKIKEVPINFQPRTEGESKIIKNEMQETLRVIFLLQLHNEKLIKFLKFGTVGLLGTIINTVFLYLFSKEKFPEWAAWALSTELAIISNFIFNNIWTFSEQKIIGVGRTISKFVQFNLSSLGAVAIQTVFGTLGVHVLGPQYRLILVPFIVVFLVLPYNYAMYNIFIPL